MTYQITKQIRIRNYEEDWSFGFTTNDDGSVDVTVGVDDGICIPKDCIQHFIDALEQLK